MPSADSEGEGLSCDSEPRKGRRRRRLNVGSIGSVGATAIAVAGGAAYLLMRFSYSEFYKHFGLLPEDVGLSRGEVLAQTALGLLLYLLQAVFAALILTVVLLVGPILLLETDRGKRIRARLGWFGRHIGELVLYGFTALLFVFFWVLVPLSAGGLGEDAANEGKAVTPDTTKDALGTWVPIFDAQVLPIEGASRVGSGPLPEPLQASERRCTLYLGTDDGTMLLFHVRRQVLIRLPASSAALELPSDDPPDLPEDCLP